MANEKNPSQRSINRRLDNLNKSMDDLYSSVYSTRPDNKNDMNRITDDIEDNLDDIVSTINSQNISNISTLINRIQRKNGYSANDIQKQIETLASDSTIMDAINMENVEKYIQAEDYQYDLILKYVPKLEQALEIMKDNVLSSDNFTKDFVNIVGNKTTGNAAKQFSHKVKVLMNKYDIQNLFEEMYIDTSKYGEYFLYQVPYKTAYERLLRRKQAPVRMESVSIHSIDTEWEQVIFEATSFDGICNKNNNEVLEDNFLKDLNQSNGKVILKMDPYEIIPEAVEEVEKAYQVKNSHESLTESFMNEQAKIKNGSTISEDADYNGTNNWHRGSGALNYSPMTLGSDGLVSADGVANRQDDDIKIKNIPGCIMHKISREQIIPIYIGDMCVGYYYFSVVNDYISRRVVMGNQFNSLTSSSDIKATEYDKQNDMLIGRIAADLSNAINAKFINANVDLKDEIYAILRYNDEFNASMGTNTINVSFIPAEDIHHFYFELDKDTHRGISDLRKAVVPAMLYSLLYLTDIINKVSRSQDHRIYYVKQNVEQNVARTMMNVLDQIKKGNMGMRQLENMNTIFNVIGKYNDFIVPQSQSGDSPIQFEVMQGQQIDTPTDLMDRMEEAAVSSTDVPYEFVQSVNQVDFATRFTMSNSKFLRKVFKRQYKCQVHFTEIFRKLYNFEYNENETTMQVLLPAPAFLTMTNSQQLVDNIKNFSSAIAEIELINNEDLKPEFIRLMTRNYLGSYIDYTKIDALIESAKQNLNINTTKNQDVSDSDVQDMMNDDGGL